MSKQAPNAHAVLSQQTWPARSHIAIFIRCLHLLDLDLLEDWPGVTEQLFTAKVAQQTLQQRVKAVEWSLYRLFEIFDPSETKDKLRPFFPALTQLQSLNLRAALYRCLVNLKKTGVLGKDAVLRKTMLDDCKGERFEEVVVGFAMGTLIRATTASMSGNPCHTDSMKTNSCPIDLAYRISLRNNLGERQRAARQTSQELDHLESISVKLQTQLQQSQLISATRDASRKKELRILLNARWIGNDTWTDVLLHGLPVKSLFEYDDSQKEPATSESQQLLNRLNDSVKKHQSKLSEWKLIAKHLASSPNLKSEEAADKKGPKSKSTISFAQFREHQALNLSDWTSRPGLRSSQHESYSSLLDQMKQELAESVPAAKRRRPVQQSSPHQLIVSTPSSDPIDMSQLPRNGFDQHWWARENLPAEELPIADASTDGRTISDQEFQLSSSISSMDVSDEDSPRVPNQQENATTLEEDPSTPVLDANRLTSKVSGSPMSPSSLWMSLADRTRASMSLSGHQSILSDQDSPESIDHLKIERGLSPGMLESKDDQRHATLLERTRKSMSMFPDSSMPRSRGIKIGKRASQVYPVNQFQTPIRTQRQPEPVPVSGTSTPRDSLFDADAGYDSVFKSRPKLALSPAFGPIRRDSGLDGILKHEMDRLDLDVDEQLS